MVHYSVLNFMVHLGYDLQFVFLCRHHHTTGLERFQCNTDIYGDHENIALIVRCTGDDGPHYNLLHRDAVMAVCTFKFRKYQKCWVLYVGKLSAVLIEVALDKDVLRDIWSIVSEHFDCDTPILGKGVTNLKNDLFPLLDNYIQKCSKLLVETPLVIGEISKQRDPDNFSAYFYPAAKPRINRCIVLDQTFEETCVNIADLVDEGYNFLRVEASEIIAFLATDCDRIIQPGIPPHIPLAYGLRGPSLSMKTMHAMVNDIRTELHERNTSVLCEVYDGQFHDIIVRDQNDNPLTRLQLARKLFSDCMENFDKSELIGSLMPYSQIGVEDLNTIMHSTFRHEKTLELDTVTITMR